MCFVSHSLAAMRFSYVRKSEGKVSASSSCRYWS